MNTLNFILQPFRHILILIGALTFVSCASVITNDKTSFETEDNVATGDIGDAVYSVYLIGDAGYSSLNPREPSLSVLRQQLMKSGKQSAVIFLGDNVYPDGLEPEEHPSRAQTEERLWAQLKTVEDYPGRIIFIPGNHDWHSSGEKGLEYIRRQEQFIESYLDRGNTFMPDSGFSGPVSVSLSQESKENAVPFDIQLLILDTQWWLHPHEKPFREGIKNEEEQKKEILSNMEKMVDRHEDDEMLVAAHHPLFSYDRHGGKFPPSTHLLPPVFGSLYVAYRNIWGYHQDISNYKDLKNGLVESFKNKDGLIYASGHGHSLQFIPHQEEEKRQYYLVSGSGSVTSYVRKQRGNTFTYEGKGFVAIHYYSDRTKKVQYWSQEGNIVFEKYIVSN